MMTCIGPNSFRCAGPALLLLAVGCAFDTMPRGVDRVDGGSFEEQKPAAREWRTRIISGQIRKADAGSPEESSDAGMREADANSGRKLMDAGRQRDAATPSDAMLDAGMPCTPGVYEGEFEGPVTFAVGSINRVAGNIIAVLVSDPSGGQLQVRDGMMTGQDNFGIGMSAAWTGILNCQTRALEDGRQEDGAWENGTTFTGTLTGMYAPDPASLSGTWQVQSEQIPLAGGNGTWRMTLRAAQPAN
jgi:hypothetical protein